MDALLCPRRRCLLLAAGALALTGCSREAQRGALHVSGSTMGTTWNVKIAHAMLDAERQAAARAAVHAALDGIDRRMSIYRDDSELSAFNRAPAHRAFALSPELFTVLAAAEQVSELSRGAFDVTVAPLVETWGFGVEKRRSAPAPAAVEAQRPAIGWHALQLVADARSAIKLKTGLRADLGAIAKGFGVDLAARALDALGIEHYMVEAGGEVRTRGINAEGRAWQIGIEQPDAPAQRARLIVPQSGQSMATSGDYRIYYEQDGKRYSHEIDPARGAPIDHRLCSVTVVDADCMRADALATALIVLGPQRGYVLAVEHGMAAYFIERESDGTLRDRATPAFNVLGARAA